MTMTRATHRGSRVFALLAGAAVVCAAMATTAAFDPADARSRSFSRSHSVGAYDRNRFHHVRGHRYGSFYRCHGCRSSYYVGPRHGTRSRGVYGGHHFEGR